MSWALPVAAAAFWIGLLSWQVHPPWLQPWMGLAVGTSTIVSACIAAPRREMGPAALSRAGLVPTEAPATRAVAGSSARVGGNAAGSMVLLVAGVLALGSGWGGVASARLDSSLLGRLIPRRVEIAGTLREDPASGPLGWFAVVDVTTVSWGTGAATTHESSWVQGSGPSPRAVRGDRVWLEGVLRTPADPGFDEALRHRGIPAEIQADRFQRAGPASNPFVRAAQVFRSFVGRSIGRLFPPKEVGLLLGLALGDAAHLEPGVARDFQATGLGHLLVVSGENVAMVLAPALALATMLRLRHSSRLVLALGTVSFFVVLTGAEPSVMRAGVMASLALLGASLGRPRSTASILSAAILVLVALDPWLIWSIGFQLSVAATAGMAALAAPLGERIGRHLPDALALAAGTSLGAQLGVAPILLFHFHDVPGVTMLANLLAFPAVPPALLCGLAAGAIGVASPVLGRVMAAVAMAPLRYLEFVANRLAKAPVAHISSGGGLPVLLLGAGLIFLVTWWLRTGWHPPRKLVVLAAALFPLLVWSSALGTGPPSGLTIRFIDVGQGDAALVTTPDGADILFDGGPDREQVAARLSALGVKRLDVVVATHPHADHIVGLPAVLTRFPVGLVLEPGCPDTSSIQADLDTAIEAEKVPVRYPRVGDTVMVGAIRLDVLSPDRCWVETNSDPNNDSLVVLVSYREDTVLFGGEPEQPAQQEMLDEHEPLPAEVMKVPHHGAATSLPAFFQAVEADVAVISVGPNRYGHPVPSTIRAIQDTGSQVWRTDQHGDIVVTFDGRGPVVASAR